MSSPSAPSDAESDRPAAMPVQRLLDEFTQCCSAVNIDSATRADAWKLLNNTYAHDAIENQSFNFMDAIMCSLYVSGFHRSLTTISGNVVRSNGISPSQLARAANTSIKHFLEVLEVFVSDAHCAEEVVQHARLITTKFGTVSLIFQKYERVFWAIFKAEPADPRSPKSAPHSHTSVHSGQNQPPATALLFKLAWFLFISVKAKCLGSASDNLVDSVKFLECCLRLLLANAPYELRRPELERELPDISDAGLRAFIAAELGSAAGDNEDHQWRRTVLKLFQDMPQLVEVPIPRSPSTSMSSRSSVAAGSPASAAGAPRGDSTPRRSARALNLGDSSPSRQPGAVPMDIDGDNSNDSTSSVTSASHYRTRGVASAAAAPSASSDEYERLLSQFFCMTELSSRIKILSQHYDYWQKTSGEFDERMYIVDKARENANDSPGRVHHHQHHHTGPSSVLRPTTAARMLSFATSNNSTPMSMRTRARGDMFAVPSPAHASVTRGPGAGVPATPVRVSMERHNQLVRGAAAHARGAANGNHNSLVGSEVPATNVDSAVALVRNDEGLKDLCAYSPSSANLVSNLAARVERLGRLFVDKYTERTGTSADDSAQGHFGWSATRYLQCLKLIVSSERKREGVKFPDFVTYVMTKESFHLSLLACCIEISIKFGGPAETLLFPWVLTVFDIHAYDFFKVIEPVVRVCDGVFLGREVVKHLGRIEERIVDTLAWKTGSPLLEAVRAAQGMPHPEAVQADPSIAAAAGPLAFGATPVKSVVVDLTSSPRTGMATRSSSGSTTNASAAAAAAASIAATPRTERARSTYQAATPIMAVFESPRRSGVAAQAKFGTPTRPSTLAASSAMTPNHPTTNGGTFAAPSTPSRAKHSALHLFVRKVYALGYMRVSDLCEKLHLTAESKTRVWTVLTEAIQMEPLLLRDRTLDLLVICSAFIIAKVGQDKTTSFKTLLDFYKQQPNYQRSSYEGVLLTRADPVSGSHDTRGSIVKFYNEIFMPQLRPFASRFVPNGTEIPPASPIPLRIMSPSRRLVVPDASLYVTLSPRSRRAAEGPLPQASAKKVRTFAYEFGDSPTKHLEDINDSVRPRSGGLFGPSAASGLPLARAESEEVQSNGDGDDSHSDQVDRSNTDSTDMQ
ncbi:retinoblastoma-associated protein B, variant [Capsaspora owczarzaki ATCC 30864]|uniref:Retinoblastoma-associated protein B n=1 Tax=Capsaspora owczarzaki (strain ATCC 30864) TaxID=595528 RepID=E9CHS1_CAPO3|nr:retinoblastoma-associated protein B [Capsaspora owczarzaki ATCC 30864]XP_011270783.1 retinoblastoma-associated protein B, variant [Capsaspora owczarzaki ATCC 30864]KJE97531.1 retinoblastoma-associated protein B [Capsaspora owczarzaki ATCC 30864]|eukprot:XP_004343231.1 retinoblastoma-associated protein B [Capsaspora owczarzaki ATCC 30864]